MHTILMAISWVNLLNLNHHSWHIMGVVTRVTLVNGKCKVDHAPVWSIGGLLISLSVAIEPVGG